MTENEAIECLTAYLECESRRLRIEGCNNNCNECELCYFQGTTKQHLEGIKIAIQALEKQIPKKPIMKQYYEDSEEKYLCCPTCGEILTDRIPADNKTFYFHCMNCGQKFDWGDSE